MKKVGIVLATLLMLCSCVLGCGKPEENVKISIVVAPGASSWLSTYAITNGIVTSDNVELEITLSPKFGDLMMSGNYDMGAIQCAALAVEEEINPGTYKALCTFISGEGSEEARGVCLICSRKDSGINTVEDIIANKKTLTIGVSDLKGSTTSIFLGFMKKLYGITEDELNIVDKPSNVILEMLHSGDIDVAMLDGSNSNAQIAYYDDSLQVVWNLDEEFFKAYGVYHSPTLLAVKSDLYEAHPEAVIEAREMLLESAKYAEKHMDELTELCAQTLGKGTEAQFYKDVQMYHSHAAYEKIEGKTLDGVMAIIQLGVDRGIVKELPNPNELFIKIK